MYDEASGYHDLLHKAKLVQTYQLIALLAVSPKGIPQRPRMISKKLVSCVIEPQALVGDISECLTLVLQDLAWSSLSI